MTPTRIFCDPYLVIYLYHFLPLFSDKYHFQVTNKPIHQSCRGSFASEKRRLKDSPYKKEIFCVWVVREDWIGLHFFEDLDDVFYDDGLVSAVENHQYKMAKYLISQGAKSFQTSINLALQMGDLVMYHLLIHEYQWRASLYNVFSRSPYFLLPCN